MASAHAVNMYEAKTHLSKLVAAVEEGAEVIINRNGRPVAKLVPIEPQRKPREPGFYKGRFWIADDFDEFTEQDERDWYGE